MAHKNGIVWEQTRFKVAFFRGKIKIVWDTLEFASPKEGSKKSTTRNLEKNHGDRRGSLAGKVWNGACWKSWFLLKIRNCREYACVWARRFAAHLRRMRAIVGGRPQNDCYQKMKKCNWPSAGRCHNDLCCLECCSRKPVYPWQLASKIHENLCCENWWKTSFSKRLGGRPHENIVSATLASEKNVEKF